MDLALGAAAESPDAGGDLPEASPGFAGLADPALPMVVGRFRLTARLGMGGMGTVYEAVDTILGRTVALKMIRGFRFSSDDEMSRFQREAQATARLDHPNIVPVYEIGDIEGCPFLSMKLICGGTLADRLKRGKMPAAAAAGIMAKVAQAVHHAHQKGVLHRDLKPSNILLDQEGEPWLTDFGMAQMAGVDAVLTLTGAQIGTPQYMSPEQAAGLVRDLTTASDVWSLGALFYQMLSGQAPYEGESSVAILHQVVAAPPPRLCPGTRRELDLSVLIDRCLQKEPADRLPGANLLAEELQRWLRQEPVLSRPVSPLEKGWRWAGRNRRSFAGGAVAMAGLALGIGKMGSITQPRAVRAAPPMADNIISREGSRLVMRDVKGQDQLLWVSARAPGFIGFREEGRYFQMPDGSMVLSTTDGISLEGVTHIVVDGGAGKDNISVTEFEAPLPNLQINGGPGDDLIHFWRPISFLPHAGLDVDLQDDAPEPGLDSVQVNADTIVQTSGTGTITVRCSGRLWVGKSQLRTVDGGITLEANQQAIPTKGQLRGIELNMAGIISEGQGPINLSGRGGSKGIFQMGISLTDQVVIQGGTRGAVTLRGQGGTGNGQNDSTGINIGEEQCLITSKGADIVLEGQGNGSSETGSNNGIVIVAGTIQGKGKVTLEGKGGATTRGSNHGVLLRGPSAAILSGGGDIRISGQGGGTRESSAPNNCGVLVHQDARVQANGSDNITVEGCGGLSGGNDQVGVLIMEGGKIDAAAGSIRITGHPGNDSSPGVRVLSPGRVQTGGKEARVAIEGEWQEIEEGSLQVK